MKSLRWFAFAAWVICLTLRLSLPAWDVCWHRDGRVCDEVVPRSCCDAGIPSGETNDEDCSDCTDIHLQPGTAAMRAPTVASLALDGPAFFLPVPVLPATVVSCRGLPDVFTGVAPPGAPTLHGSIPLRC